MDEDTDRFDATRRRAREVFDASVESVDGEARSRLSRARLEALSAAERRMGYSPWLRWVPVAVAASAALVAVLLWRAPATTPPVTVANGSGDSTLEAVESLADGEDLDLVANDLEFYAWLDATDFEAAGGTG